MLLFEPKSPKGRRVEVKININESSNSIIEATYRKLLRCGRAEAGVPLCALVGEALLVHLLPEHLALLLPAPPRSVLLDFLHQDLGCSFGTTRWGGRDYIPTFFSLKSFAKIQKNLGQKNNHAHCGVLHLHLAGDPASNLLTEWLRVVVPTGEGAAHGHHAPDPSELVDARLEAAQGHNHAFRFFEALTLRYNRCLLAALDGARASEFDET